MSVLLAWLKAVAEETRLRLLVVCSQGEFSVSELTFILGQSQPRVSRHLKLLCDAGLLVRYKEQTWVFYGLPNQATARQFIAALLNADEAEYQALLALDQRRIDEVLAQRDSKAKAVLAEYLRQYQLIELSDADEQRLVMAIRQHLSTWAIGNLLDIGTGSGRMLRLLAASAKQAIGVDIAADMLNLARTSIRESGFEHCMVRHGNMYRLPYPDEAFNTVTMDTVLVQASRPLDAAMEAYRLLCPNGFIIVIESQSEPGKSTATDLNALLSKAQFCCLNNTELMLDNIIINIISGQKKL